MLFAPATPSQKGSAALQADLFIVAVTFLWTDRRSSPSFVTIESETNFSMINPDQVRSAKFWIVDAVRRAAVHVSTESAVPERHGSAAFLCIPSGLLGLSCAAVSGAVGSVFCGVVGSEFPRPWCVLLSSFGYQKSAWLLRRWICEIRAPYPQAVLLLFSVPPPVYAHGRGMKKAPRLRCFLLYSVLLNAEFLFYLLNDAIRQFSVFFFCFL